MLVRLLGTPKNTEIARESYDQLFSKTVLNSEVKTGPSSNEGGRWFTIELANFSL